MPVPLPQSWKRTIRKFVYKLVPFPYPVSHAQAGEDRVLRYLFDTLGIQQPNYLDIGANHPYQGSNTYLFYENGSTGVCIEPDPELFRELSQLRKKDKCFNIGITFDDRREAEFYIFPIASLNTLSKEEATHREKNGSHKIKEVITIPLKNINEIIAENFSKAPDILSIDVEGIDLAILRSLDLNKHRPTAICAETITYSENRTEQKITEITEYLTSRGYLVYADTHINTIFVDKDKYRDNSTEINIEPSLNTSSLR